MNFLNDACGGTAGTDRNLCIDQATYNGRTVSGAPASLQSNGTANLGVATAASGATTALTLHLAEDAWRRDAQYSVSLDGKVLLSGATVTASNALGQSQAINLQAALSPGKHDLSIAFLNDAYGGVAGTDRNLFIKGIDLNGVPVSGSSAGSGPSPPASRNDAWVRPTSSHGRSGDEHTKPLPSAHT